MRGIEIPEYPDSDCDIGIDTTTVLFALNVSIRSPSETQFKAIASNLRAFFLTRWIHRNAKR